MIGVIKLYRILFYGFEIEMIVCFANFKKIFINFMIFVFCFNVWKRELEVFVIGN